MKNHSTLRFTARLLFTAVLIVTGACQTEPAHQPLSVHENKPVRITSGFTAAARVTAIAPAERRLTLQREDGTVFELQVDPSVRNFEQVAVGDTLRVRYQETLTALKLPAGSVATPVEGAMTAGRAKAGAKPGAGVGLSWRLRVRIESIDREREVVVFSLASGELIARHLETPEGRAFAADLKVGDIVQLDYAEALALAIEKV
jgi:hypothetical protein